ncbi:ferrochelatase [Corynebacterium pseudopelargi]|uniref:Coproporphyrin III ferrochelatase n=1 Tax=Corynebacterium pseudopelargi TaxID=2080757 RepID=A0A3G6IZ40_9CORY|nr:ferrochelatase [Corynebacterium pseudopelargi]AZA09244.1 Ferrochelatase [Corynebacterium pseudopelargi]
MQQPDAISQAQFSSFEDIDALLVLSFGGPEGVDEVRPFLENVTRGRGIPPERLDEVGEHYYHFDGKSPLNDLNREIIANVEAELQRRDIDLPVYFGNRNWKPFANDAAEQMAQDGVKKAAVFATSAWGGYSGCRQYGEDIQAMREHLESVGVEPIEFLKLRQFFDHPTFIDEEVEVVEKAFQHWGLTPEEAKNQGVRLVFTAHSIPVVANEHSGTQADGALYSQQINEAARLVAQRLGFEDYDVVWQSASGNGRIPWLEPDIVDHATALREQGVEKMVVSAIGFISDHMEVVWDLDHELQDAVTPLGLEVVRADTIGHTDSFAAMVVDLIAESIGVDAPKHLGNVASKGCTLNGAACEVGCCQSPKRPA